MQLILMRHGETEDNAAGIIQGQQPGRLNERGRRQADATALHLRDRRIDALFCSDLARAVETLQPISVFHTTPVEYLPELRERSLGVLEGRPGAEYIAAFEASSLERTRFCPVGGESILVVQKRTDLFIARLRQQQLTETVLVCTHRGVLCTITARLLQIPLLEMLQHPFCNASLTWITLQPGGKAVLCALNSIEHLQESESSLSLGGEQR